MVYGKSKMRNRKTKRVYKKKTRSSVGRAGTDNLQCNSAINAVSRSLTMRAPNNRSGNSVVPNMYYTTLPWYEADTISVSTSSFGTLFYKMNGLYKPSPFSSHQPRGYDELSALYQRYNVYKISYDITLFTKDTTKEGFKVGVTATPAGYTLFTDETEMEEYTLFNTRWTTITNERPSSRIRGTIMCHNAEQITKSKYNDDVDYEAGIGANPTLSPNLIINAYTLDGSTANQGVECNVNILFYCRFSDPQKLTASQI